MMVLASDGEAEKFIRSSETRNKKQKIKEIKEGREGNLRK